MADILNADAFAGRGSPAEGGVATKLADLESEFRDLMKTAVADQGKDLQPDILAMVRGPQGQGPDIASLIAETREVLKAVSPDLTKDWTLTSPLSTGLVPFDLEAPSKKLFPVLSPLRNMLPRAQGRGTSRRAKRITAISGSGQSKPTVNPFHSGTSTVNFGSVALRRPPKIDYAADEFTVTYRLQGLSDSVDWVAQWAGAGFEDPRELSNTILLKAMMLAEERALLGGRGTDSGLSGAFAAPGTLTATVRDAAAGETAITGSGTGGTNVYVKATVNGILGEGVASAAVTANIANGASKVIDITIPNVQGAPEYRVYASFANTGGADPGDASRFYVGRTGYKTFTVQGPLPTSGAVPPAGDTSASANAYDGILSQLGISGTAGYYKRLDAKLSATLGEFQSAFFSLWDAQKADPDEVWVNGSDRRDVSEIVKNNGNTQVYRLAIDDQGGMRAGLVVVSMLNETTGKEVKLTVHPWLPQGNAPILSYSLPFPSSEVPNVFEVVNVQDYFSVQWPQIQNTFDASVYLYGALVFYAPAFCGLIQGVQPQ